ncbi:MAG: transcriptional regulator [Gammaproteobacteria bacterium]|nr:transcriptional regulator [Gammaproteobacteria bacterium]
MKPGHEQPHVPRARDRTIRQHLVDTLRDGPVSVGALSGEIGLPEKQIQDHLESLRRQVRLVITPARCASCGFEFTNRRRTRKPGKCPGCRSTHIDEPLYSLGPE